MEGLLLAVGGGLQGGEIVGSPKALRPLIQFAARAGQLGRDPGFPVAAPTELRGVLPPLKYRPLAVSGWVGPSQEESEVSGLKRVPSGEQKGKPIVAKNAQAEADQGSTTSDASVAHLGSAYCLGRSPRGSTAAPVAFGVSACELEEPALSLAGPLAPFCGGVARNDGGGVREFPPPEEA